MVLRESGESGESFARQVAVSRLFVGASDVGGSYHRGEGEGGGRTKRRLSRATVSGRRECPRESERGRERDRGGAGYRRLLDGFGDAVKEGSDPAAIGSRDGGRERGLEAARVRLL